MPAAIAKLKTQRASLPTFAPLLALAVFVVPVLAGLAFTILPAFGYLPALGGNSFSFEPFRSLAATPGIWASLRLSITTGFAATILALGITSLILAGWHGTAAFRAIERLLSPLLSVPHAAAAFGVAFLIAPSGWIARLFSPWATGWDRPPDALIVQDPEGLSLILGLVVKEVPFLLLMSLASLPQARANDRMRVARALGYTRATGWLKTVFPAVYAQVRLPVYAVLAFSLSVVDVAMILGPSTPPTLAVRMVDWMSDPDLSLRFQAAAAALVQFGLVAAGLLIWRGGELVIARIGNGWAQSGSRGTRLEPFIRTGGIVLGICSSLIVVAGLVALALWSVAGTWRFPDAFPEFSLTTWMRHAPALGAEVFDTVLIASLATSIAVLITVACLEAEHRNGSSPTSRSLVFLYIPLLVPQVAFLMGLQTLTIVSGIDPSRAPVVFVHLVFVLPYVFLSLSGPWRAWDERYSTISSALGASRARTLFLVRMPMLLRAILTASAIGFAVSVGQYLPTLLIGGGRVPTLTTEAVALASGNDRRLIGLTAILQTATVFLPFLLAYAVPRFVFRNRTGLIHG